MDQRPHNGTTKAQGISDNKINILNHGRWVIFGQSPSLRENHRLLEQRGAFIGGNKSLLADIEQEVINSWDRSKKLNINPDLQASEYRLKTEEMHALLKEKRNFLDVAQLSIKELFPLLDDSGYMFGLLSEKGVLLSLLEDISPFPSIDRLNASPGSILTEDIVGTSAVPFCMKHKKIVQVVGAYHYSPAFSNHLSTVIPIFNAKNEFIGTVLIIRNMIRSKTTAETQKKILNWASALNFVISRQLALLSQNNTLQIENRTLGGGIVTPNSRDEKSNQENVKYCFSNIIGHSSAIKYTIHQAQRFSRVNSGVLITGESGTGKELFAQSIHNYSRRSRPFVAINCAAIPSNLIASELFGYVGGAFTGASRGGNIGKIEAAHGGTLFLDEIGDMPLDVQLSFLRVLEDKKITKVGEYKPRSVDFVFISATNRDLSQLVEEGKFREDLFYRLEVLQLDLPPLRDRGKDILLLAKKFISDICQEKGLSILPLSQEVECLLMSYSWPGNIRQLKNTMTYAVSMCPGAIIRTQDLPMKFQDKAKNKPCTYRNEHDIKTLQQIEAEAILKTLKLTNNNVSETAKRLDTSKATVYRKIKDYGINIS